MPKLIVRRGDHLIPTDLAKSHSGELYAVVVEPVEGFPEGAEIRLLPHERRGALQGIYDTIEVDRGDCERCQRPLLLGEVGTCCSCAGYEENVEAQIDEDRPWGD